MGFGFEPDPNPLSRERESWMSYSINDDMFAPCVVKTGKGIGRCEYFRVVLRMHWTVEDGRWHGHWEWVEDKRRRSRYTPAEWMRLHSGRTHLPTEILVLVCENAASPARNAVTDFALLRRLVLVCRSAQQICAPRLYHTLVIDGTTVGDLLKHMRSTTTKLGEYARKMKVSGGQPWATYTKLAKSGFFPQLATLVLATKHLSSSEFSPFYHPRLPFITLCLRNAAKSITSLCLVQCSFVSSADLIRFLESFPSLSYAILRDLSCARLSRNFYGSACKRFTQLRRISISNSKSARTIEMAATLSISLAWARQSSRIFTAGFPGIDPADVRPLLDICACLCPKKGRAGPGSSSCDIYLDPAPRRRGWVAWIAYAHVHVEFHLVRVAPKDGDQPDAAPPPARVRHVVLRARHQSKLGQVVDNLIRSAETIMALDRDLSMLTALSTFTFENNEDLLLDSWVQGAGGEGSKFRFFSKKNKRVQLWDISHEQARKFAIGAEWIGPGVRAATVDLRISPLWVYDRHQDVRRHWER